MKTLKKMPKKKLAVLCYELQKSRLPTISTTKKGMPRLTGSRRAYMPKRTKRKARLRKGSPEAKRYMAKLRRMRKKR